MRRSFTMHLIKEVWIDPATGTIRERQTLAANDEFKKPLLFDRFDPSVKSYFLRSSETAIKEIAAFLSEASIALTRSFLASGRSDKRRRRRRIKKEVCP